MQDPETAHLTVLNFHRCDMYIFRILVSRYKSSQFKGLEPGGRGKNPTRHIKDALCIQSAQNDGKTLKPIQVTRYVYR